MLVEGGEGADAQGSVLGVARILRVLPQQLLPYLPEVLVRPATEVLVSEQPQDAAEKVLGDTQVQHMQLVGLDVVHGQEREGSEQLMQLPTAGPPLRSCNQGVLPGGVLGEVRRPHALWPCPANFAILAGFGGVVVLQT
eukprot:9625410-Alexandrium_andersonii.AAC.1